MHTEIDSLSDRELKESVDSFNRNPEKIDFSRYDYLITLVGYSFEPSYFFLQAVNPKKTLFICTPETEKSIDVILEKKPLKPSQYIKKIVNGTDTPAIYSSVKEFSMDRECARILIDGTAGKKAMTMGISLAGFYFNYTLAYCDYGGYDNEKRRPVKGTEFPVLIKNPYNIFGTKEIDKARGHLSRYDFDGALLILEELERGITENIGEIRALINICRAY
ncbi:MAG: hypothetical protein ABIA63_10315, partial [bacterium]